MRQKGTRTGRAGLIAGLLTAGVVLAPPVSGTASADDAYPVPPAGLAIVGHGFGHGHGLGQYGAQGAALQGVAYRDILAHYYPGTALGALPGPPTLRVLISEDTDNDVTVRPDAGLAVAAGSARWVLPGGPAAWRIVADGGAGQHVEFFDGAWHPWNSPDGRNVFGQLRFEGPARIRLDLPGGGGRAYRGTLTAVSAGGAALRTVDTVDMDQYLWGVVPRESPASWPAEALRAQAVAARSYAAYERAHGATASWDICSTTSCQVYAGSAGYSSSGVLVEQEPASSSAAVAATSGQVVLSGGQVAFTQFSASTGGWNAAGGAAYLAAAPDPWDDFPGNPVHTWTTTLTTGAIQAAYPTVGQVQQLRVTGRDGNGDWGGRITSLVVTGSAGSVAVSGEDFRSRLGLRSPWWAIAETAITAHWRQLGGAAGVLGPVLAGEYDVPGGRAQDFQGGSVYWSPATGAWAVWGEIRLGYLASGGPGALGLPLTDELPTPDGVGRYNHFQAGSVYWTPGTGAHDVRGSIRVLWSALAWETGPLGYPLTGELPTPDGIGRYSHFQAGSIYWTLGTGAQDVRGLIRQKWAALGWETSALGYPTTGELPTPDGVGRYNHFQGGSVYWSPVTGAHEVRGAIRLAWSAIGWETSVLGYPVSDEYAVPGGRRSDFQHGYIGWDSTSLLVRVVLNPA